MAGVSNLTAAQLATAYSSGELSPLAVTRELLELWRVPPEPRHPLPANYLDRLSGAPLPTRALCQALILSGFVLDGHLSWRELKRLDALERRGILADRPADVRRRLRRFLAGGGLPLDGLG